LSLLSALKCQPFAVEAFFESSLVLTYAVPAVDLLKLIPPCLQLDTLNNEFGFIAVAVVKTKKLRPKGFPEFLGNDFILTGFRVFVKYTTSQGKRLRGLYILKSETDRFKMAFLGNLMTSYNYSQKNIIYKSAGGIISAIIPDSDFNIEVDTSVGDVPLPIGSPFADWKAARRFAGPLPFTFTYNPKTKKVLIIEGLRQNWIPKPVAVINHHVGFIQQLGFKSVLLANAFVVQNIPYQWKKGRFDLWKG
jgi:hypothetical protein